MTNHYHLLLSTPQANLAEGMKFLSGKFTQRLNMRNDRDGPLFRGRYQALPVETDSYLLALTRYIHLNPVAAEIHPQAATYPWSSCRYFVQPRAQLDWLTTDFILKLMGDEKPHHRYRDFISKGEATGKDIHPANSYDLSKIDFLAARDEVNRIVGAIAQQFGAAQEEILSPEIRHGKLNPARSFALLLAATVPNIDRPWLAKRFQFTGTNSMAASLSRERTRIQSTPHIRKAFERSRKYVNKGVRPLF